jgi:acyl-coenzyme A thioesterase PaaI-like protein
VTVTPDEQARRSALLTLAEATRRLCDVVATTAVAPPVLAAAEADVRRAVLALDAIHSDDRYSGLMDGVDFSDASRTLPLSPIIGAYSPVRPEVELWLEDGRVLGRAVLERKHVGPPHSAHGGVGALMADQLMALVPWALQLSSITKTLSLRYRKSLPLHEELRLEGWGESVGDSVAAHGTISAGDVVCIEVEAELVSRSRLR